MASRRLANLARIVSLPGSVLMIACLFLPQARDCNHHVHTPASDGWAPILIIAALLGAMPVLWLARSVREAAPLVTTLIAVFALGQILIGIPVAIYLAYGYSRMRHEGRELQTAAASAFAMLVFLLAFPIVSTLLDRHWMIGGYLTWAAAWIELLGLVLWIAAAGTPRRAPERVPTG